MSLALKSMYGFFVLAAVVLVSLISHNIAYELADLTNSGYLQETGHGWAVYQKIIFYTAFIALAVAALLIGISGARVVSRKTIKVAIISQFIFYTNLEIVERLLHGSSVATININNVYLFGVLTGFALTIILVSGLVFAIQFLEKKDLTLPKVPIHPSGVVRFQRKKAYSTSVSLPFARGPPCSIFL